MVMIHHHKQENKYNRADFYWVSCAVPVSDK